MPGVASVRTDALARTLAATAPREEKPRICRYELAVPVLFSHLRNADAASERHWRRSKSSLRPAACLYTRARHLRATCVLFSWRLPSNPKRASIPSFEKEPWRALLTLLNLALWSLKDHVFPTDFFFTFRFRSSCFALPRLLLFAFSYFCYSCLHCALQVDRRGRGSRKWAILCFGCVQ